MVQNIHDKTYRLLLSNKKELLEILVEHQSTIDHKMLCRTKEYCERIIKDTSCNENNRKLENLSIVVPIVLYTGGKKWDALKKYEGAKVVGLRHSYYVIDINEMNTEELLNSENLIENILGTEKLKDEEIYQNILKIAQKAKKKGYAELMEKLIKNEFAEILTQELECTQWNRH